MVIAYRCSFRCVLILGELVGAHRQKAEHAMFENHFERRASSTKRLHNARAKTCAEDHAPLFEIPHLCLRRTRLERKSANNHSEIEENPPRIGPKSTKNRSWAVLGAQGRFRDASGRARNGFLHARMSLQGRSGHTPGTPRVARSRPKAFLGHHRDAPRASR